MPADAQLSPCGSTTGRPVLGVRCTSCGRCGGGGGGAARRAVSCCAATLLPTVRTKNWRLHTARTCGSRMRRGQHTGENVGERGRAAVLAPRRLSTAAPPPPTHLLQVRVGLDGRAAQRLVQRIQNVLQRQVLRLHLQRLLAQRVGGCGAEGNREAQCVCVVGTQGASITECMQAEAQARRTGGTDGRPPSLPAPRPSRGPSHLCRQVSCG